MLYENPILFTRQVIPKLKSLSCEYQGGVDKSIGDLPNYEEIKIKAVAAQKSEKIARERKRVKGTVHKSRV